MSSTNAAAAGLRIDPTIPPVTPTEGAAEESGFPKTSRAKAASTHSQIGEAVFIARGLSKDLLHGGNPFAAETKAESGEAQK